MMDETVRCISIDGKTLVFGMDWLPLLGGRASQQAVAKARRHKASHYVVASDHAAAMGLVQLSRADQRGSLAIYSAAQVVAGLFPAGTIALTVGLGPGVYWLVAAHEGAVIARTDLLLADPAQVEPVLSELRAAYAQMRYLGADGIQPGAPDLAELARCADDRALLRRVAPWRGMAQQRYRLAMFMAIAVVVLWVADPFHWAQRTDPGPEPLTPERRLLVWERARATLTHGIHIHGVGGMQALLTSLYQVPVLLNGWRLSQASCRPNRDSWRCIAAYRRVARQADSQGMMTSAPQAWALRFPAVDDAEAEWVVEAMTSPLANSPLDDAARADRYWLSSLQQVSSAFVAIKAAPAAPLLVPPPLDEQGQAIPKPAGFRTYQRRSFQAEGPLRSFSVLLPNLTGVRWHVLTLSLKDLGQPTLTQSRLHLSGQGERYEWQM